MNISNEKIEAGTVVRDLNLRIMKIVLSCFIIFSLSACNSNNGTAKKKNPANQKTVLQLLPGENNPRNSEGDFITLKHKSPA
jgi:hypothetical protein